MVFFKINYFRKKKTGKPGQRKIYYLRLVNANKTGGKHRLADKQAPRDPCRGPTNTPENKAAKTARYSHVMARLLLSMVSHAQATPRYGTMDARPTFQLSTSGCHLTKILHCAHASHAAAVRCCTASSKCFSVCQPAQGRSRGTAPRLCASGFASNWSEASAECAAHGAALCTHLELAACCKTGCAMDMMLTWTRSRCGSEPSSEQVTLPRIDSRSRQNRAACSTHGITNQTALRAPISGCGLLPALTAQVEPPLGGSKLHRQALRVLTQVILPRRANSNWNIYYPLVSAFIAAERARPWEEPPASFSVVELGTAFGGNADHLLASLRGAHVTAVDPFLAGYDPNDAQSRLLRTVREEMGLSSTAFSQAWAAALALEMRAKYHCRYRLLHALSAPAAAAFADRSVDVLFVDGLHTEAGVTADLHAWWPKLAGDAIVLFNDYDPGSGALHPGVARAVHATMKARGFPRDALFVGGMGRAPGQGNAALCLPQGCKGPRIGRQRGPAL